jgi:hypothetical protein
VLRKDLANFLNSTTTDPMQTPIIPDENSITITAKLANSFECNFYRLFWVKTKIAEITIPMQVTDVRGNVKQKYIMETNTRKVSSPDVPPEIERASERLPTKQKDNFPNGIPYETEAENL